MTIASLARRFGALIYVRFGSQADLLLDITSTAGSGGKADV